MKAKVTFTVEAIGDKSMEDLIDDVQAWIRRQALEISEMASDDEIVALFLIHDDAEFVGIEE